MTKTALGESAVFSHRKDYSGMSEQSHSVGSIPSSRMSVKRVLADVLTGLPVVGDDFTARADGEMSAEEFYLAFGRLLTVERAVMLRCRFKSGDLWNTLHEDRFRGERKRFMAMLAMRMGTDQLKKYLKRMRQFGWVAHKWSPSERSDKHSWTWYVENAEDEPGKSGQEALPFYLMARCVDAETIECVGSGDRHIAVRIPSGYRIVVVAE